MRCLQCQTEGVAATATTCPACGVYLPSLLRDVLPAGTTLRGGAYRLDYPLGRGGFGITYRAVHTSLEQVVAIKEFYPQEQAYREGTTGRLSIPTTQQGNYERGLTRFIGEGRLLARLKHPGIVRVSDLFEERGTAYLVMELVEGRTLRAELDAQPDHRLPTARVEHLVAQVVAALSAVHAQEVYHLDISPENILLTADGRAVLVDFGAARQGFSKKSTQAFRLEYAAPEVLAGKEVGPQSDLFELGMVAYELLRGTKAPSAMDRLLEDRLDLTSIDEPWRSLLQGALRVQAAARPANVTAWWDGRAKEAVPGGTPHEAHGPATVAETDRSRVMALRGVFVDPDLARLGMVCLLGLGQIKEVKAFPEGQVLVLASGGASFWDLARESLLWEIEQPTQAGAISEDGGLLALAFGNTVRLWNLRDGTVIRCLEGFWRKIYGLAFSPDGRLLASRSDDHTVLWDIGTGRELRSWEGGDKKIAFRPDGRLLAVLKYHDLELWDVTTGEKTRCLENACDKSLAMSPDGRIVATEIHGFVRLWELASGREVQFSTSKTWAVDSVAFSPDARLLAAGIEEMASRFVRISEVSSGRTLLDLKGHKKSVCSTAFGPDGRTLASGSDDQTVRLWELPSGREVQHLERHSHDVLSVAFSPDGRTLASGSDDQTVRLWEVASMREVRRLWGSKVAFSPDGNTLAAIGYHVLCLWDPSTGSERRRFEGHQDSFLSCLAFSPDGRILATGGKDRTVRLWEVASGRELRRLKGHKEWVHSVAFSLDGRILASGASDNTVRLWDATSGKELRSLQGYSGQYMHMLREDFECVAFSPDGRIVAAGNNHGYIRLWEVVSGRLLSHLEMERDGVNTSVMYSVAFSPDGLSLASGSSDKLLRLWDPATGRELLRLEGHTASVHSVAYNMKGDTLATGSSDGTVLLWHL